MMGRGWPTACLVLAVLTSTVRSEAEPERWSRQATAERRQGDWVPLTCAHCRPNVDQGPQASDSLPSVLTPPPRSEGARLLPPPPPDGLFRQAASGFLQAYTHPRKPQQQYLEETTDQLINRPQAQFLKSSPSGNSFVQEPSTAFQPPQQPIQFSNLQPNRQSHLSQFNQQAVPHNPYLNQPLLIGPQFLAAPFFPQPSIPQNIQQINPVPIQPLNPISPNVIPDPKQNFQVSDDRPQFVQQITAGVQEPPTNPPQHVTTQTADPQLQYTINETASQGSENEKDEVQLLYVPVEALNQRGRNPGKQKSLPTNQQDVAIQQVSGAESSFKSASNGFDFTTRKPHFEDQANFNTESHRSKQQYHDKPNVQFQEQSLPEDQEQFHSQTHAVRQQFINQQQGQFQPQQGQFQQQQGQFQQQQAQFQQQGQFQQQPLENSQQAFKLDSNNKQYNFKQNDQFQQQIEQSHGNINGQFNHQENNQFQQVPANGQLNLQHQNSNQFGQLEGQDQSIKQAQQNFRAPETTANQHFTSQVNPQQPLTQLQHEHFNTQGQFIQQELNANNQFQQTQVNQPALVQHKDQHYINQPIRLDHQLSSENAQIQHQAAVQQIQTQQPEPVQQTVAPVTETRVPDVYTTQQNTKTRLRNNQQSNRNAQQFQNSQFTQFPQDFQQHGVHDHSASAVQSQGVRQNQQSWTNQEYVDSQLTNQEEVSTPAQQFISSPQHVSSLPPTSSSTILPPQTTPTPNQPPLSVYMETTETTKVNDVLRLLKNAKTIPVLDTVGPDSPQVFVGPSNLKAPTGYIKFELPYLNTIESNRVERKVEKLPFFVAPLNFNPPPGYSKIPFPAPHIGSVVVSNITVLKNALHEKPFGDVRSPVPSSSERYLDQYTLPAEIPPISPQLPSLVNSLQDEIYDGSTTAFTPTTESTTTVYTTPSYRGRGTSRGSHRASSSYPTSPTPTRRSHTRTRRPYDGRPHSRRQPVTTSTTTAEPSTEASVQHFTPHSEQAQLNNNGQFTHNTNSALLGQLGNNQQNAHSDTYYNEQFVANNFNQGQLNTEQQTVPQFEDNQQISGGSNIQNVNQYSQNVQVAQSSYAPVDVVTHPTAAPSVGSSDVQEEHTFKSQRTSGQRRDPLRQQQRFRGRQRLTTTTTTEAYQETIQPVEQQFNHQVDSRLNYQNIPRRNNLRNQNQERLVESIHFTAPTSENSFSVQQTERSNIGIQTTERLFTSLNDENFSNQNDQLNNQQTFQGTAPQSQQADHRYQQDQALYQSQAQFSQPAQENFNRTTFDNVQEPQQNNQHLQNQFQQVGFQRELAYQQQPEIKTVSHDQTSPADEVYNQFQQNNYDQSSQLQAFNSQEQQAHLHQLNADPASQPNQVQNQEHSNYFIQKVQQNQENQPILQQQDQSQIVQSPQRQQISNQFESIAGLTSSTPQEPHVQTHETEISSSQIEDGSNNQHNQHRLVKYNRPHSREPISVDTTTKVTEEHTNSPRRGQLHFQANTGSSDTSTVDEATTKASLVRVRGRVRSRLRGSTRNHQPTTTEAPNYPSTFLSRQKVNQGKDDIQDYAPRKRVNYSTRQTISTSRNPSTENLLDQDNANFNDATERQSTSSRFVDYIDVATTTTTTEDPTTKVSRKYQHILNRNKVRRLRPTNSPSTAGSSGTTKFLLPTSPPPVTRLPSTTRGRIRKPQPKSTTTEYPQVNPTWNEKDNFAPSAGSNEILEPFYQTKDKSQSSFGFQRPVVTPKPTTASIDDEAYWNQAVSIQQSTSFDFKPDASSVTPASFPADGKFQGSFSPIWDGQIELQDGNLYDIYNQQQVVKGENDQTPFSSDNQKVVFKNVKNKQALGKDNQYNEKTHEVKKHTDAGGEENLQDEKIYPVYREVVRPAETIQEETSQVYADSYEGEQKSFHEKDIDSLDQHIKNLPNENTGHVEEELETKEGPLKRKIFATAPGKKGGRRRGSWVRVRVRKPQDMFETAESQNLASLSENAIQSVSKTVNEKGVWTPERSTELPQTTPTESSSEPDETINFEDALKDMLKEFITNPEEENKEDVDVEAITVSPIITETKNNLTYTEQKDEIEEHKEKTKEIQVEEFDDLKSNDEDTSKDQQRAKTANPDVVTSDVFTYEPTTLFQTDIETTLDPEITTIPNDEEFKTQHSSRVLGTSTTTEISLETEICYRGRCVKTKKADKPDGVSDLMPME